MPSPRRARRIANKSLAHSFPFAISNWKGRYSAINRPPVDSHLPHPPPLFHSYPFRIATKCRVFIRRRIILERKISRSRSLLYSRETHTTVCTYECSGHKYAAGDRNCHPRASYAGHNPISFLLICFYYAFLQSTRSFALLLARIMRILEYLCV